jgi:hypothetical protein
MKNITNTLNKLTKLLAVAIFSVSLNAFSIALAPFITISTDYVSATAGTAITPVTITKHLVHSWYGWCSYLRNSHQYYHPLHSQQQER